MNEEAFHNKEVLTTAEALKFCRCRGCNISSVALYTDGLRYGFMHKSKDDYHWEFDRVGLSTFLMESKQEIPPGYVTVSYLAKKHNYNGTSIYLKIKKWGVDFIRVGNKRIMYVNEKMFDEKKKEKEPIYLCK